LRQLLPVQPTKLIRAHALHYKAQAGLMPVDPVTVLIE